MKNWGGKYFQATCGDEILHQDNDDNGVKTVNFSSEILVVKSTIFLHRNIRKYTCADGKTHSQIDHILIERRWHSSVLHV